MKKTLHLRAADAEDVQRAAGILRRGGLVAFATETVYGLGANAFSEEAVAGIFAAKGRPAWDPLIVHLADAVRLPEIARIEGPLKDRVEALVDAFWPGPLTLLLPRTPAVPDAVTARRPLVGVRVPAHPAALALLRAAGLPIAAPSANRFGHTSPTTAEHVLADLDGRIDAVLDAGPCAVGVESTVLDPGTTPMAVYRAGAVTADQIASVCGVPAALFAPADALEGTPASLPSPGVGIRHYAPEVPVRLTAGEAGVLWAEVLRLEGRGLRVGVLLPGDWPMHAGEDTVAERWGVWTDAGTLATGLFAGLRALENRNVDVIVCPLPEEGGVRDALRDRLMKAARAG